MGRGDLFERLAVSAPADSVAAKQVSAGTHFDGLGNKQMPKAHWDHPPPMRPVPDHKTTRGMIGYTFGRFTVVGLLRDSNPKKGAAWVVRCACGDYETRKAKAIRNSRNSEDRCAVCRYLVYIQRRYKQHGAAPIPRKDS